MKRVRSDACTLHAPQPDPAHALQGWRLHEWAYRVVPAVTMLSNRGVAVASEVLGLELRDEREARMVRLHDRAAGEDLLTHGEAEWAREEATAACRAAETRVAELEARLRALAGTQESSGEP